MTDQIATGSFAKLTYNRGSVSYYKISEIYFSDVSSLIKLVSLLDDTDTKIIMVLPDSSGKNNYYTEGDNFSMTFMKDLDLKTSDILLTGYPDIDINIMSNLEDSTFTALCQTDRYARSICGYERLWKIKLDNFIEMKGIRPKINPEKTSKQNYMDLKKKFSHPYMYERNQVIKPINNCKNGPRIFEFQYSLLKSYDPSYSQITFNYDNDEGYPPPDMNEIFEAYPEFRGIIKRGDTLTNVEGCQYYSKGSYFYDGNVALFTRYKGWIHYGTTPEEFRAFTEFIPGYWNYDRIVNKSVLHIISDQYAKRIYNTFNWSLPEYVAMAFDLDLYDESTVGRIECSDPDRLFRDYFIVHANGMNHVVFFDKNNFMELVRVAKNGDRILPIIPYWMPYETDSEDSEEPKESEVSYNIGSVSLICDFPDTNMLR